MVSSPIKKAVHQRATAKNMLFPLPALSGSSTTVRSEEIFLSPVYPSSRNEYCEDNLNDTLL
jgi:hypothetical protein